MKMKIHELVEKLGLYVDYNKSVCNPNDNLALYYLENNVLTNCTFESFFDCNYEDVAYIYFSKLEKAPRLVASKL